jgi:hypothetical protein
MKVSSAELAQYRRQIEESDMTQELKSQALQGIAAIEATKGDLVTAISNLMATSQSSEITWSDIFKNNPEIAGDKQSENKILGKYLEYCKLHELNPKSKKSWDNYQASLV